MVCISLRSFSGPKIMSLIGKNMCTPMFIAALFAIAKLCKQPKCPSISKGIKKVVVHIYISIMEYYLGIKKNEILPLQQHG